MTKTELFQYRVNQLQRTLHAAIEDIHELRRVLKPHDECESKRRFIVRNSDEGLDGLEKYLSRPLFEIDRLAAGHLNAIGEGELAEDAQPRRVEGNPEMFQSDD